MKSASNFPKKYPATLRFWHWANSLVICGSLLTVLLNSTLFDVRGNAAYIQEELSKSKVTVTSEQARSVAHGLEDKVWDIHIYFGYALAGLFLYRIIFEVLRAKETSISNVVKETWTLYFTKKVRSTRHDLGVKLTYLLFYAILLVMVITGLSVAFDNELGISKSFSHSLKEIHGFCMYLILGFIVLHIGGVIIAERKDKKGIVSDMIGGGNLNE
jgi:cytochrome b